MKDDQVNFCTDSTAIPVAAPPRPLDTCHAISKLGLMELLRPWLKVKEGVIEEHPSTDPKTMIP